MDAAQSYRNHAISTQDSGKLIVMLYDGAVKFLDIAQEKLRDGDFESKGIYVGKAQDIVAELNNCLDLESGGELGQNLQALYNFIHRHLSEANAERDPRKIRQCREIMAELRDGWQQIVEDRDEGSDEKDLSRLQSQQV